MDFYSKISEVVRALRHALRDCGLTLEEIELVTREREKPYRFLVPPSDAVLATPAAPPEPLQPPVQLVLGDTQLEILKALATAKRLLKAEGVARLCGKSCTSHFWASLKALVDAGLVQKHAGHFYGIAPKLP